MTAKTLTAPAYCACCGEQMQAGEPFRWVDKQVAAGSKVGSYRTVHRPAHVDRYCGARQFATAQLTQEIADVERTMAAIEAMPGCEVAVTALRARIDTANAKLAEVATW